MKVGDKVKVIETIRVVDDNGLPWTKDFHWDGEITQVTSGYVETRHRRNIYTHPCWKHFMRAYFDTWTKHYFHPTGELTNIIF